MVAAPYKINLNMRNKDGMNRSLFLTASDVNAAAWVYPSGGTEISLSSQPVLIYDVILSAAGTDTTTSSLFVNGVDTSVKIVNAANLGTTFNRQVFTNPISIPAGATVKFVQNT